MEDAIRCLFSRHPILGARLEQKSGELLQVVEGQFTVDVPLIHLVGEGPDERWEESVRLLRQQGRIGLDLALGPLAKPVIHRLSETEHILGFVVHHAICDGWSSQVLIQDLAALYLAGVQGQVADLPALTQSYADFAEAQFQTYESGSYEEELDYWRQELENPPPPIELPSIRPRHGARDWACDFPAQTEPVTVLRDIRDLARRLRVTPASILLACLSILLHQRSGATDMLIGISTLNRWSKSAMLFVGCATNLLPARIRLQREAMFSDHCAQVQATMRSLVTFGQVPLELILRETQQALVAKPSMPIWYQFREAAPVTSIESLGLRITPLEIERVSLQCDLELDLQASTAGLRCEFAYRSGLLAPELIRETMTDFGVLVRTIARAPNDLGLTDLVELCDAQ